MSDKSNKPDLTDIDAASGAATTQQKIPCAEGAGSNPVPFRFQANVNLHAVAEFIVEAADQEEAKASAEKILDAAYFNITRDLNGGLDFYVPVRPECVEIQVLEVEKSSGSLPPNTEGLRAAVQAVIGQSVLAEMECRQIPEKGLAKNRDNILAAFDDWEDDARYHMAMWVWRAYLRLYPEQAVKDEHENYLVRFGL